MIAARVVATMNGNYRAAATSYEHVWRRLSGDWKAFQRYRQARDKSKGCPLPPAKVQVLGLLAHELANAYAMFGDCDDGRTFADHSLACYDELAKATATDSLSVRLGKVRALVVRQQSCAYVDFQQAVEQDFTLVEQAASLDAETTDEYELAKSYHFRSICAWFRGRYDDATKFARESYVHARKIDAQGWRKRLLEPDLWWAYRDGGSYGPAWWQAIASATFADILACRAYLDGDTNAEAQAQKLYAWNRKHREGRLRHGISRMPSAIGMYEWLLFRREDGEWDQTRIGPYLKHREERAEHVEMLYCQVLAQICLGFYYREIRTRGIRPERRQEEEENAYNRAKYLAEKSHNQSLLDLIKTGHPVPMPRPVPGVRQAIPVPIRMATGSLNQEVGR
jgi:hypothetical protein